MRYLAMFSIAMLLVGCGGEPAKRAASVPAAPVKVEALTVAPSEWAGTYVATGTVRARTTATVAAKLMGYASQVRAQAGERVQAGQVLVVLDARDMDTAVSRAEAARQEVRSAIPEAESGIASAKANMELAQTTLNRMQELLQKKSISPQEFDEASARLKAAQAAYGMSQARRTQLDSKLRQSEEEVRSAGINRAFTTVTAPFAGIILTRTVEPGTLVVPGAPLFVVEREGAMRLEAAVEESNLGSMRLGAAVQVTIAGIAGGNEGSIAGRIGEIVPTVDALARTGTVKIDLPAVAGLRSGQFGRAAFAKEGRQVIAVPEKAIVRRGQLESVFVVESGTGGGMAARVRLVTLGGTQNGQWEVLSGLSAGDRVVTTGTAGLSDGTPVEIRQ